MQATEEFHRVLTNRHQYAREWKQKTGYKVMGYFCTYVPEEIIYAAGILPVRVLGGHEPQDMSETHIFDMYCPHCRDCLAQGLQGKFNYLDGITAAHPCTHIRQTFASWQRDIPVGYSYYLYMPANVQSRHAQPCFATEIAEFKKSIEEWLGQPVTDQSLREAIDVYDANRRLMRRVYELRKSDAPPISGVEALEMVLASMVMDKREHNALLTQALEELPHRKSKTAEARLMIIGSENDDVEFMGLVESFGATIVTDDLCTGSRYFWNEASPNGNPISALADRYVNKPPCPQRDIVERRRLPYILALAKEYRAQGAIISLQKFCDSHEYDAPAIQSMLKANGIPSMPLELDFTTSAGQIRTRIEAFIETLSTW